jgi:hypothetical protein
MYVQCVLTVIGSVSQAEYQASVSQFPNQFSSFDATLRTQKKREGKVREDEMSCSGKRREGKGREGKGKARKKE